MLIEELEIKGAWLIKSAINSDNRGRFREWFKMSPLLEQTGKNFQIAQANMSTSSRGVIRGIHFTNGEAAQSKYVTCVSGRIFDVIVDIREDSPTFLKWLSIDLSEENGLSVLIDKSLGHGFMSLEENSTIAYLVDSSYHPGNEYAINPLDTKLNISWPNHPKILSKRDSTSLTISEHVEIGNLPKL